MPATELTVESLTKAGLSVAITGFTGANPDYTNGNSFVNAGKTFVAIWAQTYASTVTATISPDEATVESDGLGTLVVSNAVLTIAAASVTRQMGFIKVPVGYNTAGKCTIVWTRGGAAWDAGDIKVAIIHLDD